MSRLSEWARFFSLARHRTRSPQAYHEFQRQQAQRILASASAKGYVVQGKRVLDLGCGLGGYTLALSERGANVVALDAMPASLAPFPHSLPAVCADALHLPFLDHSYDAVFCASLIEHVPDPLGLLREIRRVLVPGGACYLSFPPFYSPRGGHQFAPFHLLGERAATWIYRKVRAPRLKDWQRAFVAQDGGYARAYRGFGLHKVTIASSRQWIRQADLDVLDMSTRFSPINTVRWPVLGEFLTWHAEFILQKPT